MIDRVECERCGAHKDRAVWTGRCLICGYGSFRPVPLNDADRAHQAEQLPVSSSQLPVASAEPAA